MGECPAQDAGEEYEKREAEEKLTDHVEAIPKRTVRHFVAMGIAEGFGQTSAGTDPAAVSAFTPSPNE